MPKFSYVITFGIVLCVSSCALIADGEDQRAGAEALQHRDAARAIEYSTRALNTPNVGRPVSLDAYIVRGGAYLLRRQYDLALADVDRAIALDPKSSGAYNTRGAVYLFQGKYNLVDRI